MNPEIRIKRIYEAPSPEDGFRVLIDRLWPRGITKKSAQLNLWAKELTPSTELRKWFHEEPNRVAEFERRYLAELVSRNDQIASAINEVKKHTVVTLVTATKDLRHGHAAVLQKYLSQRTTSPK